jgi:hypothetical protein
MIAFVADIRPVCLAVAWTVWAVWTIKPTLNPNDEGPDFFRAFYLVPQPRKKCIGLPKQKKASVMLAKKESTRAAQRNQRHGDHQSTTAKAPGRVPGSLPACMGELIE